MLMANMPTTVPEDIVVGSQVTAIFPREPDEPHLMHFEPCAAVTSGQVQD